MQQLGGILQEQGRSDEVDGSAYWWKQAANRGDDASMLQLAISRTNERRMDDDDPDGAIFWARKAIHAGSPERLLARSLYLMGFLRQQQGRTHPDDHDGAVYWFRRASSLGSAEAKVALDDI
jgi:TPR repeat protein